MKKEKSHGDKLDRIKLYIANAPMVTKDGEVVELHNYSLESMAQQALYSLEKDSISQNQADKIKEIIEKKENQSEFCKFVKDEMGGFYFNFYKRFKNIDKKYLFRFIYLCSFMNYDNYLSDGNKLLHSEDLKSILNLGKTEFYRTKSVLVDNELIFINNNDLILINDKYCKKGEIYKTKSIEVIRMFNEAIKELYSNSLPKEHKKVALLLDILPYVNYKHNLLCKNPEEQSMELIEPLKMSELCDLLKIDKTNSSKIKKQLLSIKIKELDAIGIFEKSCGKCIYINPTIYYKGDNLKELSALINMFKVKK